MSGAACFDHAPPEAEAEAARRPVRTGTGHAPAEEVKVRPGTYAAVALSGSAVVLASVAFLGPGSGVARALGFGALLGGQALLSHCTYRLLREKR